MDGRGGGTGAGGALVGVDIGGLPSLRRKIPAQKARRAGRRSVLYREAVFPAVIRRCAPCSRTARDRQSAPPPARRSPASSRGLLRIPPRRSALRCRCARMPAGRLRRPPGLRSWSLGTGDAGDGAWRHATPSRRAARTTAANFRGALRTKRPRPSLPPAGIARRSLEAALRASRKARPEQAEGG